MENINITPQKSTDQFWHDETGIEIPYTRTTPFERNAERMTTKIAKEALKIHTNLTAFKLAIKEEASKLYQAFCTQHDNKTTPRKGNATFYNFDRSIKIEVAVNEQITFDPNTIALAKTKLDELLNDGLQAAKDFVKPLVMDAFATKAGKLDTKRLLALRRYADRITDPRYTQAMTLIDKAIRKPKSKEYFRIWIKDQQGKYNDIQLNFSAIEI